MRAQRVSQLSFEESRCFVPDANDPITINDFVTYVRLMEGNWANKILLYADW